MSPLPGRPEGDCGTAQHAGSAVHPPDCPEGEYRSAQHEGLRASVQAPRATAPATVAARLAGIARGVAAVAAVLAALVAGPARASEIRGGEFPSAALGAPLRYQIYLPDGYDRDEQRYPVVYLLHGHGGNRFDWLRHGDLQRTADGLIRSGAVVPFIVVMPDGGDRWWVDTPHAAGQTALVRDLVDEVDSRWRTVAERQGRAVAGLSAGGYGAVMAGLQHPQRFAAVAALSPAVYEPDPPPHSGARRVAAFRGPDGRFDGALWSSRGVAAAWPGYVAQAQRPAFFLLSGDADGLDIAPYTTQLHRRLHDVQRDALALRIVPGGHDWNVWRRGLGEALHFVGRRLQSMPGMATAGTTRAAGALPASSTASGPGSARASAAADRPGKGPGNETAPGLGHAPGGSTGDDAADALRAAGIFGDRMVLQRERPIPVWGWGRAGQVLSVSLAGHRQQTTVDARGQWRVELPPLPAGGPHELRIDAGGGRGPRFSDVLIGDLWLCAGQSNMEWPLGLSADGAAEVAGADHPRIRHVKLERSTSLSPRDDGPPVRWLASHTATAGEFSAVGYHFARQMQQALGVPIGLVNVAWGGTNIETWLSRTAMARHPELAPVAAAFPRDLPAWRAARAARQEALVARFQPGLPAVTALPLGWAQPGTDDTAWPTLEVPRVWEDQGLPELDGQVWLRRVFALAPAQATSDQVRLHLGAVDDCDETWLNGQKLGGQCGWDQPRVYDVPPGLLRAGDNLIAVRVTDTGGAGGLHGDPAQLRLEGKGLNVPLAGRWRARIEAPLAREAPGVNDGPSLAFDAMIRPLLALPLRGVLWYQGESNVPRAVQYVDSFALLIDDWRRQWRQPSLPFHFVQLAAFLPLAANDPQRSAWAELRDAQRQALRLPHTSMAVATDIGDEFDIHPRNKKDVGLRLALGSLRQDFGQRGRVASGPLFTQARFAGGTARVAFEPGTALGLRARSAGQPLRGFWLAGADRRFHEAQARVEGRQLIVHSPSVPRPQAVRYGWLDNPSETNLVNAAGLPASPFRSDRWPLSTEGRRYAP